MGTGLDAPAQAIRPSPDVLAEPEPGARGHAYEYTHTDGTIYRAETVEAARAKCPVLGRMTLDQVGVLLSIAVGEPEIIKQDQVPPRPARPPAQTQKTTAHIEPPTARPQQQSMPGESRQLTKQPAVGPMAAGARTITQEQLAGAPAARRTEAELPSRAGAPSPNAVESDPTSTNGRPHIAPYAAKKVLGLSASEPNGRPTALTALTSGSEAFTTRAKTQANDVISGRDLGKPISTMSSPIEPAAKPIRRLESTTLSPSNAQPSPTSAVFDSAVKPAVRCADTRTSDDPLAYAQNKAAVIGVLEEPDTVVTDTTTIEIGELTAPDLEATDHTTADEPIPADTADTYQAAPWRFNQPGDRHFAHHDAGAEDANYVPTLNWALSIGLPAAGSLPEIQYQPLAEYADSPPAPSESAPKVDAMLAMSEVQLLDWIRAQFKLESTPMPPSPGVGEPRRQSVLTELLMMTELTPWWPEWVGPTPYPGGANRFYNAGDAQEFGASARSARPLGLLARLLITRLGGSALQLSRDQVFVWNHN